MNGLVLLATIVQAVLVNGGSSSYFVRMPYPNPAGVTYSEITPYRTATSPIVVSSPATPVPSVPVINSEVIPKIGLSAGWQPEVNGLSVVNDTACIYEQCGTGDLAETAKVLFIPSKIQDVYESKLGTRFTGTQQNSRLLDLNYPVCYLPVDNSIVTPLIYVPSFGHQPGPIYNVPISGFQIPSGPLFTPQNPPLPLLPPFQVPDFFPQVPSESFLPPQIPSYPTVTTPAPPANLPNGQNDDTDSVVIENPELENEFKLRNINNMISQTQREQQGPTENYEKQILEEFSQRQILRGLKKTP